MIDQRQPGWFLVTLSAAGLFAYALLAFLNLSVP